MEYTQEGDEVREDQKINLKKLLGIAVGILIFIGILFIVQKVTRVYIFLYIWPILLAIISVSAVIVVLRRNKDDGDDE